VIHMAEKSTIKSETTVKDFPMFTAEPAALGLIGLAVAALVLASVLWCNSSTYSRYNGI